MLSGKRPVQAAVSIYILWLILLIWLLVLYFWLSVYVHLCFLILLLACHQERHFSKICYQQKAWWRRAAKNLKNVWTWRCWGNFESIMHIFLVDVSIFLACNLAYLWVSWWIAIRDESRGNWKQSGLSYTSGDYISTEECCMERKTWRFKLFLFSWDYMSGLLQQYHTVACCHLIFLLYLFQFYVYLVSLHCFAIR